jgi:hypothetical protein
LGRREHRLDNLALDICGLNCAYVSCRPMRGSAVQWDVRLVLILTVRHVESWWYGGEYAEDVYETKWPWGIRPPVLGHLCLIPIHVQTDHRL